MAKQLLKAEEVDLMLRYPIGRTRRLAKAGLIPFICLPDGEIRFDENDIECLLDTANQRGGGDE